MTQLEKYSLHLPYGVELAYIVRDRVEKVGVLKTINYNTYETHPLRLSIEYGDLEHEWMFKPYLFSLSSLTKPIALKNYNDGKSFVPDRLYGNHLCYTINRLPLSVIQQLLKWHFAIGFEPGEYIEVTDENNPY